MPTSKPNLQTNGWREWPFVLIYAALFGLALFALIKSGPVIDAILGVPHP